MRSRSTKREVAWDEMKILEESGLGYCEVVSDLRDKFMLHADHPKADKLSRRPEANGFIRADENSLLFRDASDELKGLIPTHLLHSAIESGKGLEFKWTAIENADIRSLFYAARSLAGYA